MTKEELKTKIQEISEEMLRVLRDYMHDNAKYTDNTDYQPWVSVSVNYDPRQEKLDWIRASVCEYFVGNDDYHTHLNMTKYDGEWQENDEKGEKNG